VVKSFEGMSEADMLARIMDAEAGQEGVMGKLAVGAVIRNRAKTGGYGDGIKGVITKPGQFSAINDVTGYAKGQGANDIFWRPPSQESQAIANAVLAGQYEDPTEGATHYFNPKAANPKWAKGKPFRAIGNHVFGNADAGRVVQKGPDRGGVDASMVKGGGGATALQGGPSRDELEAEARRRGLYNRNDLEAEARRRGMTPPTEQVQQPQAGQSQQPQMMPDPRDAADVQNALAQLEPAQPQAPQMPQGPAHGMMPPRPQGLPAPPDRQGIGSTVLDAFTQGAAAGFGDELTAAEAAVLGKTPEGGLFDYSQPIGERYDRALEAERGQQAQARETNPLLTGAAEMAGAGASLAVPAGTAMGAVKGASLPVKGAVGGATGAAQGGVYGFGEGEGGLENRLENAADVATVTGAVSAALPFAGRGVQKVLDLAKTAVGSPTIKAVAPTLQEMKTKAGALFKAAEQNGAVVSPTAFGNMALKLQSKIAKEGIDKTLHPKAYAALTRVLEDAATGSPTLGNLQTLRRVVGTAAKSLEPDERRLASMMIDEMDDFVANLKDKDLIGGIVGDAPKQMAEGRALWGQMRRAEIIEDVIEKAGDAASGFENGVRIGFRALLKNKKKLRGFSKDEIAAMRQITRGGNLTERGLRVLGKLSFDRSGSTNFLGGSIGIAGGAAVGGPLGAILVPLAGQAAQAGSKRMTGNAAQAVRDMAAGGAPVGKTVTQKALEAELQRRLQQIGASATPVIADQ